MAEVGGVNVHAKVAIEAADRARLEQLCRYTARPPLSSERLELHHDGRVHVGFKTPWKDGTQAVLLTPSDFISRLCALIPPPRFHMLRYHGVLAAGANSRLEVVPGAEPDEPPQLSLWDCDHDKPAPPRPSRHPWRWLLRRVFSVDVTVCARCGGPMRLLSIATEPGDIDAILRGMPPRSRAPPRAHPDQLELDLSVA
ncbi:MAG: transposase [Myxococcota bacterium]